MAYHVKEKGAGPINYTLPVPTRGIELVEVRLHLSANGGAGDFTATLQSGDGDEYNIVFNTQDMSSVADEHWQPTRPIPIDPDDEILFEWANANDRTWGLEIVYQ